MQTFINNNADQAQETKKLSLMSGGYVQARSGAFLPEGLGQDLAARASASTGALARANRPDVALTFSAHKP